MDAATQVLKFKEFIEQNYLAELMSNLAKDLNFLEVNFQILSKYDPELAHLLLDSPEDLIKAGEMAIEQFDLERNKDPIRIRFKKIPLKEKVDIRDIRSEHLEKFVVVDGVVRQKSDVRPQIKKAKFECPQCATTQMLVQHEKTLTEPKKCHSCGFKGKFSLINKELIDVQGITLEESTDTLEGGQQPKRLNILLKEDLVSPMSEKKTNPGSNVRVNGILKEVMIESKSGGKSLIKYDLILEANNVEALEEDYSNIEISKKEKEAIMEISKDQRVYEKLIGSLAPGIYGHDRVKEAILLQFLGGVQKLRSDGVRNRGDTHLLLIGDPGCIAGDSLVIHHRKGLKRIDSFGEKHLQKIKEPVTQIRKNAKDLAYRYATVFQHYKRQPVIKIITETGKEVICTFNQPFLTKKGWCRADKLELQQEIRVMPKIPNKIKKYVNTDFNNENLPDLLDEELAGLYGYIIGDGNLRKYEVNMYINKSEKDLIPKLRDIIIKKFSKEVSIQIKKPHKSEIKEKGKTRIINSKENLCVLSIYNKEISSALKELSLKRIPSSIFQSPKKVVASFISWLFEADGCCFSNGRGKTSIQLKSSSLPLLKDVQQALLFFGIQGRIIEDNLVIRRSKDMEIFEKEIGFQSKKKKEKLNKLYLELKNKSKQQKRKTQQRYEKVVSIGPEGLMDVYDFEVPVTHSFIANGIVCHNSGKSQLLKRAGVLAPKGKYVSGKGASGAGLTASVVKDEFMGGWALEAGALVLANKGICMIDELDKMSDDDRSAMHEALEQQTVTISKANIQAMLKCETSVLAAANPKMGRFDPYESLAKQINLPPALISRFDLIFPFRDEPDTVKDEMMASFILSMHRDSEVKAPDIETELLSKYIVYARKNIHPKLTENALLEIKTFYVQMRNQNSDADIKSIPITARQLEALIRLSEASAKARLSQKATKRDAVRAIELLKFCLNQIGMDKETGQYDIDNITTGVTTSQRSKVIVVRGLLRELEEKLGKKIPLKEVAAFAEVKGIGKDELEDILEKLKRSGDIFEPEPDNIQRI